MKLGFLITARLKSSRLPYKLLLDLNGKPMIERVIERCLQVVDAGDVILCTSDNVQDNPLESIAFRTGVNCFRGSEQDVLGRLQQAAKMHQFDYVLNITGENPLFDIETAIQMKQKLVEEEADFIYSEGLPIGCSVYGLKTKALEVICKIKEELDTEIWGYLINRPQIFKVVNLPISEDKKLANVRITSDYPDDFELMSQLFAHFRPDDIPPYDVVREILINEPNLLKINENCKQADVDVEMKNRINDFFKTKHQDIMKLKDTIYN